MQPCYEGNTGHLVKAINIEYLMHTILGEQGMNCITKQQPYKYNLPTAESLFLDEASSLVVGF